jgi:hypothetical protein
LLGAALIDQHVQAEHRPAKARTTTARWASSPRPLMAWKINNWLAKETGPYRIDRR